MRGRFVNSTGLNNPTRVFAWVRALTLGLCASSALARQDAPQAPSAWSAASTPVDVASTLPDSVDLVLVIDRARELRASSLGALVQEKLKASGLLDPLSSAWSELAQQLKLGSDEAFDRLVGRRVVLATRLQGPRATGSPGKEAVSDRSWAILSLVDVSTERLLFERLQAAPRGIALGHQILALERGRYELTSHRVNGVNGEPQASVIVLGPSAQSELFDDLIATLATGAKTPLGQLDVLQQARSGNAEKAGDARAPSPCEVLVLAGLDVSGEASSAPQPLARPQAGTEWSNFVVITSGRERASGRSDSRAQSEKGAPGESWQARVVVRQESKRAALLGLQESSDALARSISQSDEVLGLSLLSVVQCAPLEPVLGNTLSMLDLSRVLNVSGENPEMSGARRAVSLRALPDAARDSAGVGDRLVCTIGLEVSDRDAAAVEIDRTVARTVGLIEERFNPDTPRPLDFGGVSPSSPRVLPIRLRPGSLPLGLAGEGNDPIVLSWAFPAVPGQAGPAGWWIMSGSAGASPSSEAPPSSEPPHSPEATAAASPARLLSREMSTITRAGGEGVRERWVWMGSGRPAALEARLSQAIPDYLGIRSALKRVDRFDACLRISNVGDVIGDVGMTLFEPVSAPGTDKNAPRSEPAEPLPGPAKPRR